MSDPTKEAFRAGFHDLTLALSDRLNSLAEVESRALVEIIETLGAEALLQLAGFTSRLADDASGAAEAELLRQISDRIGSLAKKRAAP